MNSHVPEHTHRHHLLGWRPILLGPRLETITSRLEAIASRLEAISSRLEAISTYLRAEHISCSVFSSAPSLRVALLTERPKTSRHAAEGDEPGILARSGGCLVAKVGEN